MALPLASPSAHGIDPAGVRAFVDALAGLEPHTVVLARGGTVVARAQWAPYRLEDPTLLYSLSKSFTSAAAALAREEGLLDYDDRVLDHLPEHADRTVPALRDLRLRHVLTMSAGHAAELLATVPEPGADLVDLLLTSEPEHEPGTWFAYSQPATFTAGAVIQRVTGERLVDYLRPRLLDPLGAGAAYWDSDSRGRDLGFSGLHLAPEAIAAYGVLLLADGVLDGRRVLPEGWVAEASRAHVGTDLEESPDWAQGYGMQFWRSRHGFRGDGAFGQFCVVLPEQDTVLAMTSCIEDMQAVLDAAWTHLLPAIGPYAGEPAAADEVADAALADHLAGLALDLPELGPLGVGIRDVTSRLPGAPTRVELAVDGLTWHPTTGAFTTPSRTGEWVDSVWPTRAGGLPVRVRAGTTAGGGIWATAVLRHAPHRLVLEGGPDGPLTLRWSVEPLMGPDPAALAMR